MTDKQIINEVDVSGCEDCGYRGKAGYWCHNYDEPCMDYPNCNYKQLKRKEQECEELKQTLIEIKDIAENVQSFVDINLEDDVYTEMCKILQLIRESEVVNDD